MIVEITPKSGFYGTLLPTWALTCLWLSMTIEGHLSPLRFVFQASLPARSGTATSCTRLNAVSNIDWCVVYFNFRTCFAVMTSICIPSASIHMFLHFSNTPQLTMAKMCACHVLCVVKPSEMNTATCDGLHHNLVTSWRCHENPYFGEVLHFQP